LGSSCKIKIQLLRIFIEEFLKRDGVDGLEDPRREENLAEIKGTGASEGAYTLGEKMY